MIRRNLKVAYYLLAGPLMRINGIIYRKFRAPRTGQVKVHLGPGQEHYINGWVNVDANVISAKCDVWADLRNPLPFHDSTIDAIYSHHVIEHFPNLEEHFKEVYRCLKRRGVYRVAGPNGDSAIAKFVQNDKEWFSDFPDSRNSIGGRFENFIFCRREHLTILTFSYLQEILTDIGFENIWKCVPVKDTRFPGIFRECLREEFESDFEFPHTLVVEAEK